MLAQFVLMLKVAGLISRISTGFWQSGQISGCSVSCGFSSVVGKIRKVTVVCGQLQNSESGLMI
jgi:hypothetical protein